jgi:GDP-D-mannose 3', 5'-epimerase
MTEPHFNQKGSVMDWNGKRVLVTGGAGQIGSHLVARLAAAGADVSVADNLWRGHRENLAPGGVPAIDLDSRLHVVDLTDPAACDIVTRDCDVVYHLADVVAGINYVFGNQFSLFNTNLRIDANMLQAAVANRVPQYVYVGTACSYPADRQMDVSEGTPLFREEEAYPAQPESSYGWSKLMGEYHAELAMNEGLMEVGLLRFHNVYGPHCEMSPAKSQVIPSLLRKALRYPLEPFDVWGSGRQRRAFVYVSDAVDALVAVVERGMNRGVIQIGPDYSTSIREIAEEVVRVSGKNIRIHFDTSRPEGDLDRAADYAKARELLDWAPRVSIAQGLAQTYAWCAAQLGEPQKQARRA